MDRVIEHQNVAQIAIDIVAGSRRETYGSPIASFSTIAALWTAYLESES